MQPNTVFGHLALHFSTHPENLATEALSFILRNSAAASRAFTEFVRPAGLDDLGSLRFEAQHVGLEQSIPDMKCRDGKGRLRVVVENKFWAGLTENQPVTYIRELPVGVCALVLFVVPKARLQLVWAEVAKRSRDAGIPVCDVETPANMKAADIGGGHHLAVTSWGVLLDALFTAATSAGEIEPCNDIAQLRGLCRRMDEEAFLPLGGDELTNLEMTRRIVDFCDLPFDIVNEAASQGLCSRKGVKESNFRHGSGAYVRIGKYIPWIGFDAKSWLHLGVSPIWIYFSSPPLNPTAEIRELLVKFRTGTPQRCFDSNQGLLVPIFLATGVEKHRVIEDAIAQIRELVNELGVGELSAAIPNPALNVEAGTDSAWNSPSQDEQSTAEIILEVGAEGGTITLLGKKDASGQWRFWMQTDETTMRDVLDKEDVAGLGSLASTSEPVASLPEALALLDRYRWQCMTPLQVHPEFRAAILREVQEKGTPGEVASWDTYYALG